VRNPTCFDERKVNPDQDLNLDTCTFELPFFPQIEGNGGVIYCPEGSTIRIDISNCLFDQCSVTGSYPDGNGGAIYYYGSTVGLSVSDSKFTSCSASTGGAIYSSSGGSVEIVDSNFTLCTASSQFGAIYLGDATSHVLNDILFEQCSATSAEGAMYIVTIPQESTFQRLSCLNCQSLQNGAIRFSQIQNKVTFSSCLVQDCETDYNGQWYFISWNDYPDWKTIFNHCFFDGNTANSGPKDIYFQTAVSGHVSEEDFIETFGTSDTPRVWAVGNPETEYPTDWIKDGGYWDSLAETAKPCMAGCLECSTFDKCDNCDDGMEGDTCTCITGWYGTPGHCTKCNVNCARCTGSADNCEGHSKDGSSGDDCSDCDGDYFEKENGLCTKCDVNCASCTGSADNCEGDCKDGSKGTGCAICEDGYYKEENGICVTCNVNCASCTGSADHCEEDCKDGSSGDDCSECDGDHFPEENGLCTKCRDGCQHCAFFLFLYFFFFLRRHRRK
jgi:hypothetical protein